ncbi:hypothetical protein RI054_16g75250 [Pseudoscourfieldia marina]
MMLCTCKTVTLSKCPTTAHPFTSYKFGRTNTQLPSAASSAVSPSGGEIEPIQVDTFCVMLIESTFIKERISRISQCKFLKCVHPTVQFDDDSSAEVGEGTTIEHHTYIGCNVKIGRHCHIGSGCIIAHDTIIEDFCFLGQACLVAGAVRIGKGATLRSACVVAPKCSVGAWTEIGTHSAVISHIDSGICAQGIPALEINLLSKLWHHSMHAQQRAKEFSLDEILDGA